MNCAPCTKASTSLSPSLVNTKVVTSAGVLIHGCVEREHSDSDFMLHKPGEKRRQMANLFHLSRICILSLLQGTCLASLSNVQDDQSVAAKLAARYAAVGLPSEVEDLRVHER